MPSGFIGLLMIAAMPALCIIPPSKITWRMLASTDFSEFYDSNRSMWSLEALYPDNIATLNGKVIYITGYVLPIDSKGELYALSAYPFSSCFFCGGAGPESVMGLEFKENPGHIPTDAVKTFKGRLVLKPKPGEGFYFALVSVESYDPNP
jgi:hypothetical protein